MDPHQVVTLDRTDTTNNRGESHRDKESRRGKELGGKVLAVFIHFWFRHVETISKHIWIKRSSAGHCGMRIKHKYANGSEIVYFRNTVHECMSE